MSVELTRRECGKGMSFTKIYDKKFKTFGLSVRMIVPYDDEYSPVYPLVLDILATCTRRYPEREQFSKVLTELYSASVSTNSVRVGKYLMLRISLNCLCDEYTIGKEKISAAAAQLLIDCLTDPYIENGMLSEKYMKLWRYMGNTILVGAITTILQVGVTILAAFAFARLSFRGKNLIFGILLGTMMIPGEMMIITNYTTVSNLGWIAEGNWKTFLALIFPFISSVFYTFFLRQNFKQIPDELYYAAKVDGVSDFKYLVKVMLPIARPAITTVVILSMIGSWNAYIWPRTVTNNPDLSLVTNGIMEMFRDENGLITNNLVMAGMVLVSLPLLIAFVVFKKYIMNGVSRAGIKG